MKVHVFDVVHRLASWALDAPIEQLELSDVDLALVRAFEKAMLDDLSGRLTRLLELAGAKGEESIDAPDFDLWVEAGDGHEPVLIRVSGPVMIALSKFALPPASKKPPIDARLKTLFGGASVEMRAGIGGTQTAVSDLRRLAVGDVLVLDRRVDQDVLIYMSDSKAAVATATLTPTPSELSISRTAEPSL